MFSLLVLSVCAYVFVTASVLVYIFVDLINFYLMRIKSYIH